MGRRAVDDIECRGQGIFLRAKHHDPLARERGINARMLPVLSGLLFVKPAMNCVLAVLRGFVAIVCLGKSGQTFGIEVGITQQHTVSWSLPWSVTGDAMQLGAQIQTSDGLQRIEFVLNLLLLQLALNESRESAGVR